MVHTKFFLFLLAMGWCSVAMAQQLPGGLPKSPAATSLTKPSLPTTPEIPYKEELQQIRQLKKSYDSLRQELRQVSGDSTRSDSLLAAARQRSRVLLDEETRMLESLAGNSATGEELKNAVTYTQEVAQRSKSSLDQVKDVAGLETILDQNEENLKALTNEWLMPHLEERLTGNLPLPQAGASGARDAGASRIPDFYGKDALGQLAEDGASPEAVFGQAKSMAMGKARHIPDDYIKQAGSGYSKLKLDAEGNIEVIREDAVTRRFQLVEPNTLKGARWLDRMGLYLWYDPLTAFGEGVYGDLGVTLAVTHQLTVFGGAVIKRQFRSGNDLSREGTGGRLGVRMSKSNWFVQAEAGKSQVTVHFPAGYESRNFEGEVWTGGLSAGRTIPMGKTVRSVVMGSWDPLYKEGQSLSTSRFQLKIGFELFRLRRPLDNLGKKQKPADFKEQLPGPQLPVYFEK